MLCTANYTWSNVPGNSLTVTVKTGNVVLYTGTPDSGVPFVNTNITLSIDRAYTLTFEISDALNATSVNYLVQSSNIFLRLSPKTNAIGIGTYPQGDKRVEIDDEWGLYLHGQEADERYARVGDIPVVPTKVSELQNDSDFQTVSSADGKYQRKISV